MPIPFTINAANDGARRFLCAAIKIARQAAARVKGTRFACRALDGSSAHQVSINSDMTVSCSCSDFDGEGKIGDLSSQSLREILDGPRAKLFRETLAAGRFPIDNCARCKALAEVGADEAQRQLNSHQLPGGILVENTIDCGCHCTACPRGRISRSRRQTSLSPQDMRRVSAEIKQCGVCYVSLYKLGEPFHSDLVIDQITALRQENPGLWIESSTNGVELDTDAKRAAAMMLDGIHFSIDGVSDAVVQKYQRGSSFERAYRNLKDLAGLRNGKGLAKPVIEWKYVLFRWNDRPAMIERAFRLAREAGIDIISFWPARSPFYGISWRYRFDPYYSMLGQKSWKGRELRLREGIEEYPG